MSVKTKKVIYVGDDEAYFKAVTAEFLRLYPMLGFRLTKISENDKSKIQSLYHKIKTECPVLLLIDFSKNTDEYFHLARLLTRTHNSNPFHIIGLHDFLSPKEHIKEGYLTGVRLNYVKSAELFDLVYAAVTLVDSSQLKEHGFANAQLTDPMQVGLLAKVGFINSTSIHIETDFKFEMGSEISVKNFWHEQKMMPSKKLKVTSNENTILFYPFKHSLDLEFKLVDPPVFSEIDTSERTEELKNNFEADMAKSKKKLKDWLVNNDSRSLKKKVRIMVIEKELSFYQSTSRIDQHEHSIRCQPYLLEPINDLQTFMPQIIAFGIEGEKVSEEDKAKATKPPEGAQAEPSNDFEVLKDLYQKIKEKFKDYDPYVVLFNTDRKSQDVQQIFKSNHIVCFPGKISLEVILKMAKAFEAKINHELKEIKDKDPHTVFIKKSAPFSIAEIEDELNLKELSETDIVFTSSKNYPPLSVFIVNHPFQAYITVLNHPQKIKQGEYYALLNGIGETDKKFIRKFVNSVFFRDHDSQKAAETQEYFNLNKQKLEEKAAEEAKKKAEAEAQAASAESPSTDSNKKE